MYRRFILIILSIIIGVGIVTMAIVVPIVLTRRANTTVSIPTITTTTTAVTTTATAVTTTAVATEATTFITTTITTAKNLSSRRDNTTIKLVYAPSKLIPKLMAAYHNHPLSGHFGTGRTWPTLRNTYYWPRMKDTITSYIKSCDKCSQFNVD
ncbi:unnamed protein product [Rotaria sp. Silwood1]|nr:unnamed protein product [Rotaria sp. Silwood1]